MGMALDINTFDISTMIFEKLKAIYGDLKEVPSKIPGMDRVGEVKWYDPGEKALALFQTFRVQTIRDVEIKNFFERDKLDPSNSFVIMLIPDDTLPLPLFAVDVDVHKGKYIHVITDMIPLSKHSEYLKRYDEPLGKLRKKYEGLSGMVDELTDEINKIYPALKQFKAYSSSGMIFGNVPIAHGAQAVELLSDYVNLYCSFVRESGQCAILKNEDIRKEAQERKWQFLMMMFQIDFSEDMPSEPRRSG
jgi:hypothetical protein